MHYDEPLHPETKQKILSAAATVFSQDGYEGASMARIAAQGGVSKGTLYNYFDSKEAMFVSYIEESCALRLARVFDGITEADDIETSLHLLAERAMQLMLSRDGIDMYRLVLSIAPKFPELAQIFLAAGSGRALMYMRSFLERADAAGKLSVPDPQFAAEQFFALCQTKICLRRRLGIETAEDTPETLQRVVDGAVLMFLNTYGAQP